MDAVLKQALKLACLIRDSEEALVWREAWNTLLDIQFTTPDIVTTPLERIPLVEHIGHLRLSDRANARPLMFPLLVVQLPFVNAAEIQNKLKNHPKVLNSYRQLTRCLGLISLLTAFLRGAGPGYPHKDLVYTLPNTPWAQLTNEKELPWNIGESFVPKDVTDTRFIGLDRFIPSVAQQLATGLNDLLTAMKCNNTWLQLQKSYQVLQQRRNLAREIGRARVQFQREFGEISQINLPKLVWRAKIEELAQRVYSKRGSRIQAYVESFLRYEWLIEQIYWLISQLTIYESVSCLTSSIPQQLQQISLECSHNARLTALALTLAKTLQIGQLVHIALVETEHKLDGLYQVEQWVEKYQVESGARILFRARCLWHCQLDDLLNTTKGFTNQTFVPSEATDILGETRIDIAGPDGQVVSWQVKDEIPAFELTKTMYLP